MAEQREPLDVAVTDARDEPTIRRRAPQYYFNFLRIHRTRPDEPHEEVVGRRPRRS